MPNKNNQIITINGPEQRQKWITDTILDKGSVVVDELVEQLKVSRMTIHRDLDELEHMGVLRKITNGATAQPSSVFESDLRYRQKQSLSNKTALAKVAFKHIHTGQAILLDEASTILPIVHLLPDIAPVTVITNFQPVIRELTKFSDIGLICLGGNYNQRYDTFTGPICEQTVSTVRANTWITSTTAVYDGFAYHPDPQVANVKRTMMTVADKKIMLLDYTKFGKTAIHKLAHLNEFDIVIVDSDVPPEKIEKLRKDGVNVEIAPL
jgi:DeoR/GlpR family transcriptional regulator of sugar metabolism